MHIKKYILLLASVLLVVACSNDDFMHQEPIQDGPVKVGFWMGRGDSENTRTFINDDGQTISWEAEDKVALWAQKDGAYTLQNRTFDTWFVATETNQAFFTTELKETEAMSEGTYTYYACYPLPQSVSGTTATFTLPSTQDGKMGGGADIMVAQGTGPALEKLYIPEDEAIDGQEPDYVLDQNRLSLKMHHLVHALRFYVPQAKWGFPAGETVERIVFTMPQTIAGEVETNVATADGSLALKNGGSKTITLSLAENMVASTSDQSGIVYDYAVGAIMPPSVKYGANDKMEVTVYSQKRFVTQEISLSGRGPQATDEKMRMAAGRVTSVGLDCSVPSNPKISFRIKSNNLGEDPYRITLESANTYAKWNEGSNYVYVYDTGSENKTIAVGDGFEFYSDFESISTIWGEKVKVTYESKSAIVTKTIDMPEMELRTNYTVELDVPFLLDEDFTNIGATDNSQADVGQATWLQNINPDINLPGWSGSMWKTDATNKLMEIRSFIRSMNCGYKNASGVRFGRIDTAPLPLKPGKKVKIQVNYKVGGKKEGENGSVRCYFGYSNSNTLQNGGTAGTNEKFTPNYPTPVEDFLTGDVSSAPSCNVPRDPDIEFASTPEIIRLSWLLGVDIKHSSADSKLLGTHLNTISSRTFYLYLDDIQVKIVQ